MNIQEEISFIVTSDETQGAVNKSADGSYFEIQLDDGLKIPRDAINVKVKVEESTIWWVVPNIITGVNDTFYIFGDDDTLPVPVPQLFTVIIEQGLYDLTGLNQAVLSGLEALGARTEDDDDDPLPLVTFLEDEATQKVLLRLNYTNAYVDFQPSDTTRDILGFDALQYGPNVGAPINILAPNIASFNQVNYFLIHSDLVNLGIRFNNKFNQTISQVLIDVSPGSQIVSTPFNPAKSDANQLAGGIRTNLRFWLTDDKQRTVNTNGEDWTARIVISYTRPLVIKTNN